MKLFQHLQEARHGDCLRNVDFIAATVLSPIPVNGGSGFWNDLYRFDISSLIQSLDISTPETSRKFMSIRVEPDIYSGVTFSDVIPLRVG